MGYPCKNGNFICSNKFLDSLKLPVFVLNKVWLHCLIDNSPNELQPHSSKEKECSKEEMGTKRL